MRNERDLMESGIRCGRARNEQQSTGLLHGIGSNPAHITQQKSSSPNGEELFWRSERDLNLGESLLSLTKVNDL